MMHLALKIDVDTLKGTQEGVPRLLELLRKHGAEATFLFSLGPDHTGRALKRVFRPGFLKKVRRTSVTSHYGIKTLLYGTLLPGPDIGNRCFNVMREVQAQKHEVGIHCWDHVKWQDGVMTADSAWTRAEMDKAVKRFRVIFGEQTPLTHGAAGWQMNRTAYREEQRLGMQYSSDCRGTHPFWPVVQGELVRCPQLPSTLPTLDELIGVNGLTEHNVAQYLLGQTRSAPEYGHVFTLHAELEGGKLIGVFDALLSGWKEQGYTLVSTRTMFESLNLAALPYHQVIDTEIPGRSGLLSCQGPEFLPAGA
ncbi:4-deoxy-4-formamido-L-arabinose-phosphoundecaprenol deformylase [Burkholderiaceae bacterium DAT-1]|nr:4-deoxy-4-formamido-L-arabinose-phosphoundecaprenol deformylase [Burkholderiaceae bacterium DAT-1]